MRSTKQTLLIEAVKRAGLMEVATQLRVPPELVDLWMRGYAEMPDRKILQLADLLEKVSQEPPRP